MVRNVIKRLPILIRAWKTLLIYKFPADYPLICKIAANFVDLKPLEYIAELDETLLTELRLEMKVTPATEIALALSETPPPAPPITVTDKASEVGDSANW